jgi:hypothetical protein
MGSENNREILQNIKSETTLETSQEDLSREIAAAQKAGGSTQNLDKLVEDLIQGTDGSLPMLTFQSEKKLSTGEIKKIPQSGFIQTLIEKLTMTKSSSAAISDLYKTVESGKILSIVGNWQNAEIADVEKYPHYS